jgi:hypothetical protein
MQVIEKRLTFLIGGNGSDSAVAAAAGGAVTGAEIGAAADGPPGAIAGAIVGAATGLLLYEFDKLAA